MDYHHDKIQTTSSHTQTDTSGLLQEPSIEAPKKAIGEVDLVAFLKKLAPRAKNRRVSILIAETQQKISDAAEDSDASKSEKENVKALAKKKRDAKRYRGERLIEPSSSWFPPKFPLG